MRSKERARRSRATGGCAHRASRSGGMPDPAAQGQRTPASCAGAPGLRHPRSNRRWRRAPPRRCRVDLRRALLKKQVCYGLRLGDLPRRRPMRPTNATDSHRIERCRFSQHRFDRLFSYLGRLQLSRDVGGPTAVLLQLSPITPPHDLERCPGASRIPSRGLQPTDTAPT